MVNTWRKKECGERGVITGRLNVFRRWWHHRRQGVNVLLSVSLWFMLVIGFKAGAQPPGENWIYWDPNDGGNGHYYKKLSSMTYWNAKDVAENQLGAYLVTINNAEEDQFLLTNFCHEELWIGFHKSQGL